MTTNAQNTLVRRIRAAKWVNLPLRAPAPPPEPDTATILARLRELLRTLAVSDRSIRALEFVSKETKAKKLAENVATRAQVETRIAELTGSRLHSRPPRGLHGLT